MQLDKYPYPQHQTLPRRVPDSDCAREQVNKILASDTLHAAEVLRRLLRFLADKTFTGEADDLKEYAVGLDALGKPPSYDPRTDAVVRLQASRLRQKLDEYYRREGIDDSLIIEIPRGRFKISWHVRAEDKPPVKATGEWPEPAVGALSMSDSHLARRWRILAITFSIIALGFAGLSVWILARRSGPVIAGTTRPLQVGGETLSEVDELWRPFLSSQHHVIIGFINPLFIRLQREGKPDVVYRTSGNFSWEDATSSPEFPVLKQALTAVATPTFNLVERSNLISTFVLSQFLARRRDNISLARSDQISWQTFADNDVILFGPLSISGGESSLPVHPALTLVAEGVRNLQPLPGEPALYEDPPDHQTSDGEALDLISVLPGPLGRTTLMTFASNHKWALIGGVQALVDQAFVRQVLRNLKDQSGRIPPYYQLLLRTKYRDGTLTSGTYVTHRVLTPGQNPAESKTSH